VSQTADVAPVAAAAAAGTGLDLALSARAVQMTLRAKLMLDVTRLWPLLDKKHIDETWPGWLAAMRTLLLGYHAQSSTAAAGYYQRARHAAATAELVGHHAGVPHEMRHTAAALTSPLSPLQLEPPVHLAAPPDPQWVERSLGYSGPGLLSKDTARPNTALSTTLGTASRIALEGGRVTLLDTIEADPAAVGWYRVTDAQPCAFCALLASRGVVYKHDSFDQSDARFHGAGEFKVHNDCGCTLAPAFSRDHTLPATSRTAQDVYQSRGRGPALKAFRKAWAAHLEQSA
jgi:hypothetical protein